MGCRGVGVGEGVNVAVGVMVGSGVGVAEGVAVGGAVAVNVGARVGSGGPDGPQAVNDSKMIKLTPRLVRTLMIFHSHIIRQRI